MAAVRAGCAAPLSSAARSAWLCGRRPQLQRPRHVHQLRTRVAVDDTASATADGSDYYSILGLLPGATLPEIKKAYRLAMKDYHPDQSDDEDYTEFAAFLNQVYEVSRSLTGSCRPFCFTRDFSCCVCLLHRADADGPRLQGGVRPHLRVCGWRGEPIHGHLLPSRLRFCRRVRLHRVPQLQQRVPQDLHHGGRARARARGAAGRGLF